MMKMTLLEMVQDILSDLDGDVVNGIGDTEEALQVAQIIKTTYAGMVVMKDLDCFRKVTKLVNVGDADRPNYMKLPERTSKLVYLAYNQQKLPEDRVDFKEMQYMYPDEFLVFVNGRNIENDNVVEIQDFTGVRLNIIDDTPPTYWTSFDDSYIVFDSWSKDFSTTLTRDQTQAILYEMPTWRMEDGFIPELSIEMFPGLLAEAKSTAFYTLRQSPNEKAEQASMRNQRLMAQRGWRAHGGIRYPNYGRVGKRRVRSPRFPD